VVVSEKILAAPSLLPGPPTPAHMHIACRCSQLYDNRAAVHNGAVDCGKGHAHGKQQHAWPSCITLLRLRRDEDHACVHDMLPPAEPAIQRSATDSRTSEQRTISGPASCPPCGAGDTGFCGVVGTRHGTWSACGLHHQRRRASPRCHRQSPQPASPQQHQLMAIWSLHYHRIKTMR